jgi:hypothetical protein
MIGSRRTHFDVRHHMHLRALLKDFPMRVFQVASPYSMPYVQVGSTKVLDRWDSSSQDVTPTTTSFLKDPNKAFIPMIPRLLLDGSK